MFCPFKCVDPTTGTNKVILSPMSSDMCGFLPDNIAICGNVICTCLLESCSKSRYQFVQQQMFHLFLLLWERPTLLTNSLASFRGFHSCVYVDTWSPNCDTRWTFIAICALALTIFCEIKLNLQYRLICKADYVFPVYD